MVEALGLTLGLGASTDRISSGLERASYRGGASPDVTGEAVGASRECLSLLGVFSQALSPVVPGQEGRMHQAPKYIAASRHSLDTISLADFYM